MCWITLCSVHMAVCDFVMFDIIAELPYHIVWHTSIQYCDTCCSASNVKNRIFLWTFSFSSATDVKSDFIFIFIFIDCDVAVFHL
jgi:hypothetical protein